MGVARVALIVVISLLFAATLIVTIPGIPPDIEPEAFDIQTPKVIEGWFATNNILDEAEVYYESPVSGIESVAVLDDNTIFTGDQSGSLVKITAKQTASNVTVLKYACSLTSFVDNRQRKSCGWPLGMRFDKQGNLITMDYFGGMTKIDTKRGSYENLIPKSRPINNKVGYVPEDVDIAKDGTMYWTDGSTTGDFFVEMIGQPSGRLIRFDPAKQKNEVLLENLHFSNGVCLSDNEEFVLVVETGMSRIQRYYLRGEKKGLSDTFASGLPGYPDNIRSNGRGGFYVGLTAPWNDQYSMRIHLLSSRPILRKLILRSRYLLLSMIGHIKTYLPDNVYLGIAEKYVTENGPVINFSSIPKTATVVELSRNGEIIGILNGKSGKIHSISQLTIGDKYAFLNSPFENKIWRIKVEALRRMQ